MLDPVKENVDFNSSDVKVLDIGCGSGSWIMVSFSFSFFFFTQMIYLKKKARFYSSL